MKFNERNIEEKMPLVLFTVGNKRYFRKIVIVIFVLGITIDILKPSNLILVLLVDTL